jgi:hypothetical protein
MNWEAGESCRIRELDKKFGAERMPVGGRVEVETVADVEVIGCFLSGGG